MLIAFIKNNNFNDSSNNNNDNDNINNDTGDKTQPLGGKSKKKKITNVLDEIKNSNLQTNN